MFNIQDLVQHIAQYYNWEPFPNQHIHNLLYLLCHEILQEEEEDEDYSISIRWNWKDGRLYLPHSFVVFPGMRSNAPEDIKQHLDRLLEKWSDPAALHWYVASTSPEGDSSVKLDCTPVKIMKASPSRQKEKKVYPRTFKDLLR